MAIPHGLIGRTGPRWTPPHIGRRTSWLLASLVALIALIVIGAFFVDEPLRRYVERRMNESLDGYTVSIRRLSFHPIGASLTLYDVVFVQSAHPDPPVIFIPRLDASTQWREVIRLRAVANFRLQWPELWLNFKQLREEVKKDTSVSDRGWQEAFQSIYPLKINKFTIVDGKVTYIDEGPFAPLTLYSVTIDADNIRNVPSPERTYPSELHAEALVFDKGKLVIDGNADFLAAPHPSVKAQVKLDDIALNYFEPVARRYDAVLKGGHLSLEGAVEYAPTFRQVDLALARIDNVRLDWVHKRADKSPTAAAGAVVQKTTQQVAERPDMVLRLRELRITRSDLGVIDRGANPEYRVFLNGTDATITNLGNQPAEGRSQLKIRGKFMGGGDTSVTGSFLANRKGPDFDLDIRIEDTEMTKMNDLLRAHGGFDVVSGTFNFYSELKVKDGHIDGYVKPLFRDLVAYSPAQDREKGFVQKLKERVVNVVGKVMRNVPRKEVATKVDISGPLENPEYSTLQVILRIVQNAFFKAILPGFESAPKTAPGKT
ncbi:MAG: DUF748 domain-containing protein [Candidatus Rokuibacteriota bacterium]